MKFEIRMTACDRPAMLRRALESLQAQSFPDWKAIVYDDSSTTASREVVEAMSDARIAYVRNSQRRGAVGNVDQCFSPVPVFDGTYGCLLEDDNFWFPDFLAQVADALRTKPWRVVQVNQRLYDEGQGLRPIGETTRSGWFRAGEVGPMELRASLLLMEGVSNSGLVWKLGDAIDLRIGNLVPDAGLNEFCRSLIIAEPFFFIEEPLGVYTVIARENTARAHDKDRVISRGVQAVRRFVLGRHGAVIVDLAQQIAIRQNAMTRLTHALAYCGHPLRAIGLSTRSLDDTVSAFAKGLAVHLLQPDPCGAFLRSGRPAMLQ